MPQKLPLAKLHLYLDNPRLSPCKDERETLYAIVADQKSKLVRLAEDIAEYGLNTLEVIAVFPAPSLGSGHYYVAEGNRRVTALKLLNKPSLIQKKYPSIFKAFCNITINPDVDITHAFAQIFPSENDPYLIRSLELRHLGEQDGKGIVRWNSEQKARFDAKRNGLDPTLQLLDDLVARHILSQEQRQNVTKTNWERVLRPKGQEFLKLAKNPPTGFFIIPEDILGEFTQKIRLIAEDLKGKSVSYVYGTKEIEAFYDRIAVLYSQTSDLPDLSDVLKASPASKEAESQAIIPTDIKEESQPSPHPDISSPPQDNISTVAPQIGPQPSTPTDPFQNCQTVIPKALKLSSRNARISKIIAELKQLPTEDFPNACGALLRALIELSAKAYLEYNQISLEATHIQFQQSVNTVCRHLFEQNKIDKTYSSAINKELDNVRLLLNGYMHNTDSYPSSTVIRDTFKTFLIFIQHCLE